MAGKRLPLRGPVELFVVDVDSTLVPMPGDPFNLELLAQIQQRSKAARTDRRIPRIALITGRPQSYLEAMQLMVNSQTFGVFEFGLGLYDASRDQIAWNPNWTPTHTKVRTQLVARCHQEFVNPKKGYLQTGLHGPVTVIPRKPETSESLNFAAFKLSREFPDTFTQHTGPKRIHFVPKNVHKGVGLLWIADAEGVPPEHVVCMGDDTPDLPMFKAAALAFAPLNAAKAVKSEAHKTTRGSSTAGVLEAYDLLIAHNRGA